MANVTKWAQAAAYEALPTDLQAELRKAWDFDGGTLSLGVVGRVVMLALVWSWDLGFRVRSSSGFRAS